MDDLEKGQEVLVGGAGASRHRRPQKYDQAHIHEHSGEDALNCGHHSCYHKCVMLYYIIITVLHYITLHYIILYIQGWI